VSYKSKERQRVYVRKWNAKRRADWFRDKECVRCGSRKNLELDHIDPARKISHCVWTWSQLRRLVELAKCQVLCGTCHKKKTDEDKAARRRHGTYTMR
jgi:5-methylcytosine-specific restriction endonuclease McrA